MKPFGIVMAALEFAAAAYLIEYGQNTRANWICVGITFAFGIAILINEGVYWLARKGQGQ